jgi:hypothetical protein
MHKQRTSKAFRMFGRKGRVWSVSGPPFFCSDVSTLGRHNRTHTISIFQQSHGNADHQRIRAYLCFHPIIRAFRAGSSGFLPPWPSSHWSCLGDEESFLLLRPTAPLDDYFRPIIERVLAPCCYRPASSRRHVPPKLTATPKEATTRHQAKLLRQTVYNIRDKDTGQPYLDFARKYSSNSIWLLAGFEAAFQVTGEGASRLQ